MEAEYSQINLLPVDIVPDYNRDGMIDQADRGKVTDAKPWRFWVNDDKQHNVMVSGIYQKHVGQFDDSKRFSLDQEVLFKASEFVTKK